MKYSHAHSSYVDLFRPQAQTDARLYNAMLVIGGSLLIALLAQVSIVVPFSPVPITGQTLGVLLVAMALGRLKGALTVGAYLLEGAAGLPVFANGAGGAQHLAGPTGGYLAGFLVAAYVVGWLAERSWDRTIGRSLVAMAVGTAIIFMCGASWLALFVGWENTAAMGVYPYLPGGLVKICIAAGALPAAWKLTGRRKD